ncbi:MAG: CDP-6-deoxy-delta-3,4-glucoseen reductase [Propionivibrio sp.]
MPFQISVQPGTHGFQSESDETILDAALRHGLLLPYGCRDGACGSCRGKVLSGEVDHGQAQPHALNDDDRRAGFALFCCAKAKSDLEIEVRELRSARELPIKTLPARVQKMTRIAPDVMIVELKLPATERLQFLPGQYIEILPKERRRRAFSLANTPHDDACLQLHIRHVPGGFYTEHVFSTMRERDILRINGPHGSFYLREDSNKPIVLVAGGTGFAPIKAIVEHAIAEQLSRPMTIYWGGRAKADLYLRPLAESWVREHAHIHFVPVLSDAAQSDEWAGRNGLVHVAAMQDWPDLSGHQVYVCGSPAMVAAARRDFVGKCRLPENEFFADSFEFANDAVGERSPSTKEG